MEKQIITFDKRPHSSPQDKLPAAIVNVGNSITTVAVLGTDGLPFIRELRHSGKDVIEHIAKAAGLTSQDVQQQLLQGKSAADLGADINQACKRLILDVTETLAYYSARMGSSNIKNIYVCGGFSLLDDFVKAMQNGINTNIIAWNPFSNINYNNIPGSDLIVDQGPALAVAAGLAMRQV